MSLTPTHVPRDCTECGMVSLIFFWELPEWNKDPRCTDCKKVHPKEDHSENPE